MSDSDTPDDEPEGYVQTAAFGTGTRVEGEGHEARPMHIEDPPAPRSDVASSDEHAVPYADLSVQIPWPLRRIDGRCPFKRN